jgi:hypothetical protein
MRNRLHDRIDFDSFEDFLDQCRAPLSQECLTAWTFGYKDCPSSAREGSYNFSGTESYDQALQLATDGWPEGRAMITDKIESLAPYVTAALRLPGEEYSVAGYLPDVPLMCTGSPAYMFAEGDDVPARARVVRFLVNIAANSNTDAAHIMNRGAAIAAVVDYFENAGTRVEVELCMVAENEALAEYYLPVKRADEHVEPDRFAFAIAHPSMLRRFMFRMMEHNPKLAEIFGSGYGSAKDAKPDPDQVYFPSGASGCYTPAEALKAVLGYVLAALEPHQRAAVSEDWEGILTNSRAV